MLDAYIIDRIRREQELERERRDGRVPLYIDDRPPPPRKRGDEDNQERDDRGSVIIDYSA